MGTIGLEINKLREKIFATEGWRIQGKLKQFSVSVYTFQKTRKKLPNY